MCTVDCTVYSVQAFEFEATQMTKFFISGTVSKFVTTENVLRYFILQGSPVNVMSSGLIRGKKEKMSK